MSAQPGDYLTNGPWDRRWTCPACHHDHAARVTACAGCGVPLACTIEEQPVCVCTIADPADDDE